MVEDRSEVARGGVGEGVAGKAQHGAFLCGEGTVLYPHCAAGCTGLYR